MAINIHLSVITLNVNGLNALIKRHKVTVWIIKRESAICSLEEIYFRAKDTHRLKVRRYKKILNSNRYDKKTDIAILHIRQYGF